VEKTVVRVIFGTKEEEVLEAGEDNTMGKLHNL
jgi:hypothetical protein